MAWDDGWLLAAAQVAGVSLIAAVQVAGLVVTLRRWHLGPAARLAAVGFGLLLLGTVGNQILFNVVPALFSASDGGTLPFLRIAAVLSFGFLLNAAAMTLIVLGLRSALTTAARAGHEPSDRPPTDDPGPGPRA